MKKLWMVLGLMLALATQAQASDYYYGATYSAGTLVTATAWEGADAGYWTTAYQFNPGYATVANNATWGVNAIKIDANNGGWTSLGNSKTAYAYTDFSARCALGDQNWLWVRWQGAYSGTGGNSSNGYYFRVYASGANWTMGKNGSDIASGSLTGVTASDFTMRLVANGSTISAYVNGSLIHSFTDSTYATGGVAITESYPGVGYFDGLVVVNVLPPTPTITPTFTVSPTITPTFSPSPTATQTVTVQASDWANGPIGLSAYTQLNTLPQQKMWTQELGFSSYDRTGGNTDYGNWLYTYTSGTAGIGVMADVTGPGCLYRWWFTGSNPSSRSFTLLIDGVATVVSGTTGVSGVFASTLFSGSFGPFTAPLAVSYTTDSGGNVIYLPIPFKKSLKILDNTSYDAGYDYYNLGIHKYNNMTASQITSWTGSENSSAARAILNNIPNDPKSDAGELTSTSTISLASGVTTTVFDMAGPEQIVAMKVSIPASTSTTLNNIYMAIYWDGSATPAVNAPLSFFFNAGGLYTIQANPQQLMAGIDNSGNLYNYFPMPFAGHATVKLYNAGGGTVSGITSTINYMSYPGSFNGVGYLNSQFKTSVSFGLPSVINLLTANGFGSYLGSIISIATTTNFQEGDEAIYVDGSNTPIIHGTGTEDYDSAGWGWQFGPFSQPFHGCSYMGSFPIGAPAPVNFTRMFVLDQVPYLSNIQVNIQTAATCTAASNVTYTTMTWFYNQPVALINQTDALYLSSTASVSAHSYSTTGAPTYLSGSYLEDVSFTCSDYLSNSGYAYTSNGTANFNLSIPATNNGLILRGTFNQTSANRAVEVWANGQDVGTWYLPGSNSTYPWLDADFPISQNYTAGDSSVAIQLVNVSGTAWSEFSYQALALGQLPTPPTPGIESWWNLFRRRRR